MHPQRPLAEKRPSSSLWNTGSGITKAVLLSFSCTASSAISLQMTSALFSATICERVSSFSLSCFSFKPAKALRPSETDAAPAGRASRASRSIASIIGRTRRDAAPSVRRIAYIARAAVIFPAIFSRL